MKWYKLTAIKDMPRCEKGFTYSFSESSLNLDPGMVCWDDDREKNTKICILLRNRELTEFVKTEPDYEYANKTFVCPKCGKPLFSCIGDKYTDVWRKYGDWVEDTCHDITLDCADCGASYKIITEIVKRRWMGD